MTKNERSLLQAIVNSEFHDGQPPVDNYVWTDCLWGWSDSRKFPGTMASLSKKGYARTDGECCCITQAGLDALKE